MSRSRNMRRAARKNGQRPNTVTQLSSGKWVASMYFGSVNQSLVSDECDTRDAAIRNVQDKAAQAASSIQALLNGGPQ